MPSAMLPLKSGLYATQGLSCSKDEGHSKEPGTMPPCQSKLVLCARTAPQHSPNHDLKLPSHQGLIVRRLMRTCMCPATPRPRHTHQGT